MRYLIDFFAMAVLPCIVIFAVAAAIANAVAAYQCGNFQEITGKETEYRWFDSCYVSTEQGWQRWDEYKMRAAASEGLKARSHE